MQNWIPFALGVITALGGLITTIVFFSSRSFGRSSILSWTSVRTRVLTILGLVGVVLAYIAFLVFNPSFFSPSPVTSCKSGSITISGSSTFYSLMGDLAHQYEVICPNTLVNVNANSSQSGSYDVGVGRIDIGVTDLKSSNLGLVDHPIAAAIGVLVLNQDVSGITNLTSLQVQGIYNGSITNWQELGGPNLPISVVSPVSTSGMRKVFDQYVLKGPDTFLPSSTNIEVDTTDGMASIVVAKSGAIGYLDLGTAMKQHLRVISIDNIEASPENVKTNSYTFWTTGHLYTKGNPSDLTQSLLDYMLGSRSKGIISNLYYVPFNDLPVSTINNHPDPVVAGF